MDSAIILDVLRKKSPQTTLEIAKSVKKSWHMVQEELLEMQIEGKLDRIRLGGQNIWFIKGAKPKMLKGSVNGLLGVGAIAIIILIAAGIILQSAIFSLEDIQEVNIIQPEIVRTPVSDVSGISQTTAENIQEVNIDLPSVERSTPKPSLYIDVSLQKLTRGNTAIIQARIENTGNKQADILLTNWTLPEGFKILSRTDCLTIASSDTCVAEITVESSLGTKIGKNDAKIVVNYE